MFYFRTVNIREIQCFIQKIRSEEPLTQILKKLSSKLLEPDGIINLKLTKRRILFESHSIVL